MGIDEFDLSEKVAIVTGAGRGIGKAISLALAEAGANVVAAARTVEEIEETCRVIQKLGRRGLPVPTDVTKPDHIRRLVEQTISAFRKIDILVNNAGTIVFKPIASLEDKSVTEDEWHTVLNTNLTSIFLSCRLVGKYMMEQKQGKVINVSSVNAIRGKPNVVPYNISKAGICMLTQSLALEWAPYAINVNAIAPGDFYTRLSAKFHEDPRLKEKMLAHIPLGRVGKLREVGLLAVFLASPASDFITGQTIFIDGGESVYSA